MNKTKNWLKAHWFDVVGVAAIAGVTVGGLIIYSKHCKAISTQTLTDAINVGVSTICKDLEASGHKNVLNELIEKGLVIKLA